MKTYKAQIFRNAISEVAHKTHKHLNLSFPLSVNWHAGISTAGVNQHGLLYLADVDDTKPVTHATLVRYSGYVIHELCHMKWTDFNYTHASSTQYVNQLLNAIEDAWIEHNAIRSGMTGNVADLLGGLVDGMVREALDQVQDWTDPRQYPFVLAVYLRDHALVKCPLADGLKPIFDEAKARLAKSNCTRHNLEIAQWVYEQLKNLEEDDGDQDGDKDGDRGGDRGDGNGQGQDDQGDQDGDQEGDQSGDQGDPGDNQGDGQGDQGEGKSPGKAKKVDPQTDAEKVEPKLEPTTGEDAKGLSCGYCIDDVLDLNDHGSFRPVPICELNPVVPAKLRHEIKRLFDKTSFEEFQPGRRSGALDTRTVHTSGFSDRVFKRHMEEGGIDSAVAICIDCSGSMSGKRMKTALEATHALLDALGRAQVKTSVIIFESDIAVLKDWGDSTAKAKERLTHVTDSGGTNDYFAIRYAHDKLALRPEARKVCFVITDGEGRDKRGTRHQVKVGEAIGITTLGLGIRLDITPTIPKSVTIHDYNDLAGATFQQFKLVA